MNSEELATLMEEVEKKGIGWDKVEEELKVPKEILDLYTKSGPVPPRIINNLKKLVEEN